MVAIFTPIYTAASGLGAGSRDNVSLVIKLIL